MLQVIQIPIQQLYVRKLLGFDFSIEYKPGTSNKVVDALSRSYEEEEVVQAAFMALSVPMEIFLDELRVENVALEELKILDQKLANGEGFTGSTSKRA